MIVRKARPSDAGAVAEVHVRAWQAGYRGILPDGYLDALRPEERAEAYAFDDPDRSHPQTIVVTQGDLVVGFATTGPCGDADDEETGEVLALYVDPRWWGQGTGRRLISTARRRLTEGGFARAVLWVLVGNDRAERFYRADQWVADGLRRVDEVWGIAVDEIRYRRDLP
jgi:ribosomal protein S18 acetylase RimI-like enzyme